MITRMKTVKIQLYNYNRRVEIESRKDNVTSKRILFNCLINSIKILRKGVKGRSTK